MPFAHGSVTCAIYRVEEALPEDFQQQAQKNLRRYAFRPINAEKGEDRAVGWVNPLNLFDDEMRLERLLLSEYLFLGLRIDKKSPNSALLKARTQQAIADRLKDGSRKRLSADERRTIQAEQRNILLRDTSPSTVIHEALWNVEAGWLFFSSQSVGANNDFLDQFADTFGLEVLPMLPFTYAEGWGAKNGLEQALAQAQETVFCRQRAVVRPIPDFNAYDAGEG